MLVRWGCDAVVVKNLGVDHPRYRVGMVKAGGRVGVHVRICVCARRRVCVVGVRAGRDGVRASTGTHGEVHARRGRVRTVCGRAYGVGGCVGGEACVVGVACLVRLDDESRAGVTHRVIVLVVLI